MCSAHDTSLQEALEIGRSLEAHLPSDISVVTVEAERVYDFSTDLTPPVHAAIPQAVGIILDLLIESSIDNASVTRKK
jgi:hydrogenase maturation protease